MAPTAPAEKATLSTSRPEATRPVLYIANSNKELPEALAYIATSWILLLDMSYSRCLFSCVTWG